MKRTNSNNKILKVKPRPSRIQHNNGTVEPWIDRSGKNLSKSDKHIERRLLIGMITETEVCRWVDENIRWQWIQSATCVKIMRMLNGFYQQHGEAPRGDFQDYYFQWLRESKLDKDELEEWENELLPGLSEDYEEEGKINVPLLLYDATEYFNDRKDMLYAQDIQDAINTGNEERRELLLHNPPTPLGKRDNLITDNVYEKIDPLPPALIRPWLREGETVMLNAPPGFGKTWTTVLICHLLSCQNYEKPECEVGQWQIQKPAKSLFIAGERGRKVQGRFPRFLWLGDPIKGMEPELIDRAKQDGDFALNKRENQKRLISKLKQNPQTKLVVLDNLGTLFDLESENDASEWNTTVKPLFRDLEALGVAQIVVHHMGKDVKRGGRGTSAMKATADVVLVLEKQWEDKEEICIKIRVEKQNDGEKFNPFNLRFYKVSDYETRFEVTEVNSSTTERDKNKLSTQQERIVADLLLNPKLPQKEIAERNGVSPGTVTNTKQKATELGFLNGKGNPTEVGKLLMEEYRD